MKSVLKRILPADVGHAVHRRMRGIGVPYDNLYHCCTWKSASQWFVQLFSHPHVLQHSELNVVTLSSWFEAQRARGAVDFARPDDMRNLLHEKLPLGFAYPRKSVATTLYYSKPEFLNLPLPGRYKAFFVMRDPRDLLVSYYFSMRDSHVEDPWVRPIRAKLREVDEAQGLHIAIDQLAEEDFFAILESWAPGQVSEPDLRVFRYEDLSSEPQAFVHSLLDWLQIRLPSDKLAEVSRDTRFARLSGRERGQEDTSSHLRKGVSGDWRGRLSAAHLAHLQEVSPDLAARLGYEPDPVAASA